jgi:protein-tyrosine phosphatase
MYDLHSHILPGLDDGASDLSRSLAMARMAVQDGIRHMVCTPHWVLGRYNNSRPLILKAVEELRAKFEEQDVSLSLYPGAELRLDVSLGQRLEDGEILSINDTGRYALIELAQDSLPLNLEQFFWDLQVKGITPIISHPERNPALARDPERFYRWVISGILGQLTAASLLGHFGKDVRRFSTLLLRHRMVHMLVTDAHGLKIRTPILSEACKVIESMNGKRSVEQMVYENPSRIVRGEPITPDEPVPVRRRTYGRTGWRRLIPASIRSLLLFLVPLFFFSACATGKAVQQIHPEEEISVGWNKDKMRWEIGPGKTFAGDREPETPGQGLSGSGKAVQQIDVSGVSSAQEDKAARLPSRELTPKEYVLEKFKGKKIVFPEETVMEEPGPSIFRIGVADVLQVFVWQQENLTVEAEVRSDDKISLPLVGEVQAAGLEIRELEAILKKRYAEFVAEPFVTVTVKEIKSHRVFITGAVKLPQSQRIEKYIPGIPILGDNRLLTALSQVEIDPDADLREAYLLRDDMVVPLDLLRLLKDGDQTENILLRPRDTVVIPGNIKKIYILGELEKPGEYRVPRRTTLLDAVALAGGHKPDTAALNLAYVSREGGILPVDFKKLIDQAGMDQNIIMEDKDLVYIPSSKTNKVFVLGEVKKPGVFRFADRVDVVEAIAEAGDFQISANPKQVVVVRGGLKQPEVYAINVAMMTTGSAQAAQFFLEPEDIVFVPRSWLGEWNAVVSQLVPSISAAALMITAAAVD